MTLLKLVIIKVIKLKLLLCEQKTVMLKTQHN